MVSLAVLPCKWPVGRISVRTAEHWLSNVWHRQDCYQLQRTGLLIADGSAKHIHTAPCPSSNESKLTKNHGRTTQIENKAWFAGFSLVHQRYAFTSWWTSRCPSRLSRLLRLLDVKCDFDSPQHKAVSHVWYADLAMNSS